MAPVVKNPPAKAGDLRDGVSIPGLGRSPGEGHGKIFQYSCLENPMDKGAGQATSIGLDTTEVTACMHADIQGNLASSYLSIGQPHILQLYWLFLILVTFLNTFLVFMSLLN